MKIQFKDLGLKKFTKIIEIPRNMIGEELMEYIGEEANLHMPHCGEFELVPVDGLGSPVANNFAIVHTDAAHVSRGMGTIFISYY